MSSSEEGQRAIDALHGQSHDGRELTVNEARPMEPRGPRREFSGGSGRITPGPGVFFAQAGTIGNSRSAINSCPASL
jgi:hypothetical protein